MVRKVGCGRIPACLKAGATAASTAAESDNRATKMKVVSLVLRAIVHHRIWIPVALWFSIGMSMGFFAGVAHSVFVADLNQKRYLQIIWAVSGGAAGFVISLVLRVFFIVREVLEEPRRRLG